MPLVNFEMNYEVNERVLYPYLLGLQHFIVASQEVEWNGRFIVHLILGILEVLPTGINYIIAIFDAIINHNPPQQPQLPPAPLIPPLRSEPEPLEPRPDPFSTPPPAASGWASLPKDLMGKVSTFLNPKELGLSIGVCKNWGYTIHTSNFIWNQQAQMAGIISRATRIEKARQLFVKPDIAFGRGEWIRYIGDPGDVPPLPLNIYEILQSPCPFWPGKTVKETHMLTLIPKNITRIRDGIAITTPFTFRILNELITSYNQLTGNPRNMSLLLVEHTHDLIVESHWVLMTKDVIPGSINQPYSYQKLLVENQEGYEVPEVLDALSSILFEYIRCGQRFFRDSGTRCQEMIHLTSHIPFVKHRAYTLGAGFRDPKSNYEGIAGSRKFPGY